MYEFGILLFILGAGLVYSGLRELSSLMPFVWQISSTEALPAATMIDMVPSGGWHEPKLEKPGEFVRAKPGQKIAFVHPENGTAVEEILGRIKYTELWQRRKAPSEPWIPTGNLFTAHWLGSALIYEWKGKLWLLDLFNTLTDAEIKTQFLPHARRFGESDEKAEVHFAYPPGSWRVTDIGKFKVHEVSGQGLRLSVGAVGRFLHAVGDTGLENRVLVVEDYQEGGGGKDTIWLGWQIEWDTILSIE